MGIRRSISVPVGLVDVANQEGWSRSLAYWMIAKNTYNNSSIYNFSIRKLASVLGLSHTTASFHYKIWKENGLVKIHANGTLVFLGKDVMDIVAYRNYENEKSSCTKQIRINQFDNIRDQHMCLQSRIVQKNINQQARNIIRKREVLKIEELGRLSRRLTPEESRAYRNNEKFLSSKPKNYLKSINDNLQLSDLSISKIVGCSLSYAKNLKKFMKLAGILESTKKKGDILTNKRISKDQFNTVKKYGSEYDEAFFFKGHVYLYPTTIYSSGYAIKSSWLEIL